MKKPALLFAAVCAASLLSACAGSQGPVVSRVGVEGSYTSKGGETFGGGINADLAYPTPKPIQGGK